jgi:hypothetical protein
MTEALSDPRGYLMPRHEPMRAERLVQLFLLYVDGVSDKVSENEVPVAF